MKKLHACRLAVELKTSVQNVIRMSSCDVIYDNVEYYSTIGMGGNIIYLFRNLKIMQIIGIHFREIFIKHPKTFILNENQRFDTSQKEKLYIYTKQILRLQSINYAFPYTPLTNIIISYYLNTNY